MTDQGVPDEIRDFILKHIDSVAQIEALLLIRSGQDEMWDVARVATRLYTSKAESADALNQLCAEGLLNSVDGTYTFEGVSPGNKVLIQDLLAIYARQLIPVTNIIHSKPRRIRSFANAFRFRKGS
jgi:hypothetical protein